jgi:hypothetical protein
MRTLQKNIKTQIIQENYGDTSNKCRKLIVTLQKNQED